MNKLFGKKSFEAAPSPHTFSEALSVIASRFQEAVGFQVGIPEFRHVMTDRIPGLSTPLASFMLAQSYEQAIEGQGDNFEVTVPILEASTDEPMLGQPDFFIIEYNHDGKQHSVYVTEDNYQDVFINSRKPPIVDLPHKLAFYQVIPSRRPAA